MKKIFTASLAVAATLAAMAQQPTLPTEALRPDVLAVPALQQFHSTMAKASRAEADLGEGIVWDQPAGELMTYVRNAEAWNNYYGILIMDDTVTGYMSDVVLNENNEIWFKDLAVNYPCGSWVKGYKDGDMVFLNFPQRIDYVEDELAPTLLEMVMLDGEILENGQIVYTVSDDQRLSFKIDDEGVMRARGLSRNRIVGLWNLLGNPQEDEEGNPVYFDEEGNIVCAGMWAGYGDWDISYKPYDPENFKPLELPETAEIEEYGLIYDEYNGSIVKLAFDGDDVYFAISPEMPDSWFMGTIQGDKIVAKTGQYLGIASGYELLMYFMAAYINIDTGEHTLVDEVEFAYDAESKIISGPEGLSILVNAANDRVRYLNRYVAPTFRPIVAGTEARPMNPFDLDFRDYFEYYGYNYILFSVPVIDINGNVMDPNDVYFSIFTGDNEVETFEPEEYPTLGFEEPFDEISVTKCTLQGLIHYLPLYFGGVERVGVQLTRYVGDRALKSDIIYIYSETMEVENAGGATPEGSDAVEAIEVAKDVKSVEYYDIAGRRINNTQLGGLYIVKTTYTDGSVAAKKMCVK